MTRPLRIHFEGAFYHITARGNNKESVFLDTRDREKYLHFIERCKNRFDFRLHAYALMPNHVHLLIETGKDPVSKIMQALQTSYTMYFNKKYDRVGHVFQGRFKSLLCDKDSYLLELVRYIHLNPLRAGLVKKLKDYPWTSHVDYLGKKRLADTEMVLEMLGGTQVYLDFLKSEAKKADSVSFPEITDQCFIGDQPFIEAARAQSAPRNLPKPISAIHPEQIIKEVSRHFNLSPDVILGKRKPREIALARSIAIYLIRATLKTGLIEIGRLFSITTTSVTHSVARLDRKMKDPYLRRIISSLREKIEKLEHEVKV